MNGWIDKMVGWTARNASVTDLDEAKGEVVFRLPS